jgi:hypothetical protein
LLKQTAMSTITRMSGGCGGQASSSSDPSSAESEQAATQANRTQTPSASTAWLTRPMLKKAKAGLNKA